MFILYFILYIGCILWMYIKSQVRVIYIYIYTRKKLEDKKQRRYFLGIRRDILLSIKDKNICKEYIREYISH